MSHQSTIEIWAITALAENISVITSFLERDLNGSGVTSLQAFSVIAQTTSWPFWTNFERRSSDLYMAIDDETHKSILEILIHL